MEPLNGVGVQCELILGHYARSLSIAGCNTPPTASHDIGNRVSGRGEEADGVTVRNWPVAVTRFPDEMPNGQLQSESYHQIEALFQTARLQALLTY